MEMALQLITATPFSKLEAPRANPLPNPRSCPFNNNNTSFGHLRTCLTVNNALKTDALTTEKERRSANYKPSIWDYKSMSALVTRSDYTEAKYGEEVERMKKYVKGLIVNGDHIIMDDDPLERLEFIDVVQRLGLQYHFDAEIKQALGLIYDKKINNDNNDLYATALQFRLLRQHGYYVHQDVFKKFVDNEGGFFMESLDEDVKGILSLYEASFLGWKDEPIIDEAMAFSTANLKEVIRKKNLPRRLARMVDHAMDMPIHWRPNRLEARWFMDVYKEEPGMDLTLLQLAKLDYNMVQSVHQKDLAELIRWWVGLGLSNKMTFYRDRLVEHYLWSAIMVFEPQFKAHLISTPKIVTMITTIDDCYDIYGTLDEVELLTKLIDRWDITEIDRLPPAIRPCFLALYNSTNEIGLQLIVEREGFNFIPYLQKMWADQCKAYLTEAKWYHNGIKPMFKEYLNNAVFSIGGLILLLCCFLTTAYDINEETLDFVFKVPTIMRCSSVILRLNNDLGTSLHELARGDTLKAVECYMVETGSSEEAAREDIKSLVRETWKTMNEAAFISYPFKGPFVDACLNLARASQCFYQYGDGHGLPDNETKGHIMSILVEPVPMDHV